MNEPSAMSSALTIDVVSDLVCPWCWIGKGQLDAALARWCALHPRQPAPTVVWHPFQLNPDLPPQGMPRGDYLEAKFGSRHAYPAERIVQAAERAQVPMRLERIARQPNTLRAHALLAAAGATGGLLQHAMAERLFRAYFDEGLDIGDEAVLRRLGAQAGLSVERIDASMHNDALEASAAADAQARRAGISGVPFFIVGNRVGVSGAQGADALLHAFDRALS